MSQKFEKLKTLLKELFQLDQPDLDFGLYRIMRAKSSEVTQFLDADLLPQVTEAFGIYKAADKVEIEKELAKAIEQAQNLGANPEILPKVRELRAKLSDDAVDIGRIRTRFTSTFSAFFGAIIRKVIFSPRGFTGQACMQSPMRAKRLTYIGPIATSTTLRRTSISATMLFRLRPGRRYERAHARPFSVGGRRRRGARQREGLC